jgi:acyl carrier protein
MKIQSLLAPIFPEIQRPLLAEDSPSTLSAWDSLRHVEIILIVEETFGLSLSTKEIAELRSVRSLAEILRRRGLDVAV